MITIADFITAELHAVVNVAGTTADNDATWPYLQARYRVLCDMFYAHRGVYYSGASSFLHQRLIRKVSR